VAGVACCTKNCGSAYQKAASVFRERGGEKLVGVSTP
jgi:hypothetical protein